jgi:hypothetical protein
MMTAEAAPRPGPELNEGDIADYGYRGNDITEESLGSVPRLQIRRRPKLTFMQELLIRFLLEDLPPSQPAGDEMGELNDMNSSIDPVWKG